MYFSRQGFYNFSMGILIIINLYNITFIRDFEMTLISICIENVQ